MDLCSVRAVTMPTALQRSRSDFYLGKLSFHTLNELPGPAGATSTQPGEGLLKTLRTSVLTDPTPPLIFAAITLFAKRCVMLAWDYKYLLSAVVFERS